MRTLTMIFLGMALSNIILIVSNGIISKQNKMSIFNSVIGWLFAIIYAVISLK